MCEIALQDCKKGWLGGAELFTPTEGRKGTQRGKLKEKVFRDRAVDELSLLPSLQPGRRHVRLTLLT